ncbi:hybrid sensor histidine kinase/response regulator transcription factor [Pedobacter glucosidilyticus]|uniref:hybrid sensor histidine kinase/response regulator transcription factor n=1 Tax=Pedobacter glucosidilyticus TaxID=1122941 RepID=UPI00040BFFE9|nr:hybrid sensor histidine kinase/response regulator transcription factor [Pedobacter glucosidilyticus]
MRAKFLIKYFVVYLLHFFFFKSLFADDLKFKHLTIDDGLSQNTVNTIYQDHKGLIWIGTWDGLNKYDGYDFVTYKNDGRNPNSLNDNRVSVVIEDKKNRLWIGTSSGLNLFDRNLEVFKSFSSKSNKHYAVYSIVEDKNGIIWIATDDGLKYLNPLEGKLLDIELNLGKDKRIQSIYIDKNNLLWIGKFKGLYFYDFNKKKLVSAYPTLQNTVKNSWIRTIKYEEDGSYWLATEAEGVLHFKNNNQIEYFTNTSGLLSNTVRSILIVNKNEIWVGTKFGLSILNPNTGSIKNYTYKSDEKSQYSLSQASVRYLYKDKEGNIWLGTYSGGVNLVYNFKENFAYKGHAKEDPVKLSNKEINSVYEDQNKNVWLATDGGGLNYWDRKANTIKVYKYAEGTSTYNTIKIIHKDSEKNDILWLSTGGGVLKFNTTSRAFQQFNFATSNNSPAFIQQHVFEDTKQGLWIASNFGGLYLFKDGKKIKAYNNQTVKEGFFNSNNLTALKDNNGKGLWIGNRTAGLNYLNYKTGEISSYVYDKNNLYSLSNNNILCLFNDSKGRFWIGTDGGGLNYYDPKTNRFLVLNSNNGLLNNTIHAITEDELGALWLSTNRGIFKVNITVNTKSLKFEHIKIVNYTVKDGLQSNQFLHHSVYRGIDNELFFGGINGLTSFLPSQLSVNKNKPNIIFTELSILGKPVSAGENSVLNKAIDETQEIILPYNKASFTIKFSLLNFIHPEKNKYAFKLEGFPNDTWHYVNDQRQATYTNLDPGKYLLKVKAANNSGIWVSNIKTLNITILPPWYQTWWAYLAYFIIIILLLYLFYSYTKYKERLKGKITYEQYIAKQERELAQQKLSFFLKISHEIKTPITMIMAPLQKLLSAHANNPALHQYLNTMNKSGQRLLNLIDQLLDVRGIDLNQSSLKAAKGDIVLFVNEIVVISTNLANAKNIDLSFSFSDEKIEAWFDKDKMEKVIYNILSNAIKYTPEYGKINVYVEQVKPNKQVAISITDNGCGIAPDRIASIFTPFKHTDSLLNNVSGTGIGLAFAKELVDLHQGEIDVQSTPATEGENGFTCFKIKLPLGDTHLKESEIDDNYLQTDNIDNYKDYHLNRQRNFEDVKNKIKADHGPEKIIMLIVEDNTEVRNFLEDHFKPEFEVYTAENGKTGYEEALKYIPEIIISDVMMPEMDGVELCKLLKENINTSHIPIVLLTARSPLLFKLEGLEKGADEYISKPFNLDLLEVKVWNLILNRQKMRSRFQKQVLLEPTNTIISSFDDLFIERIIKYIEEHISEETLSVEDISAHIGMTRGNLYKKLKALTSKSPVEFIRYIRLQRAAQLLKQKKMYINEVAYMVGFQDVNYFRKCFKEEFDANPLEFAKQFREVE